MTTSGLRLDFDGGWIDRTGVFAAAATDAFFLLDTGAVLSIGINGMLRTLLLADQTELSVSPAQTLVMVNDGPAHQNLGNGNPLDSSGRANLLALLTELAASLTGNDVRRPKQPGAVCERHRLDTLAGADFDTSAAATATAQEVIFFPGTGDFKLSRRAAFAATPAQQAIRRGQVVFVISGCRGANFFTQAAMNAGCRRLDAEDARAGDC